MRLRAQLTLTILCVTLPLSVAAWFAESAYRETSVDSHIAEALVARMQTGEREVCEQNPERWPRVRQRSARVGNSRGRDRTKRPRWGDRRAQRGRASRSRPPRPAFAYQQNFESVNPRAPELPAELRELLEKGETVASVTVDSGRRLERLVAVRMPWNEGPCAVVVSPRPAKRGGHLALVGLIPPMAVALIAALIALFAVGPLVRRIRSLAKQVRQVAASTEEAAEVSFKISGRDELSELALALETNRIEIQEKVRSLEERDIALRDYVANTTHDLMVPLSVLQGHLASLRDVFADNKSLPRGTLAAALEESHYLASLVSNLNVAAKLQAGGEQIRLADVNLNALVERVISRHRPIAVEKDVVLEFAVPERAFEANGDVTLLEQAVSNLVHNAIRYNHEGGHVAVTLEEGERGQFRLVVLDDGPGVAPEELERLVERRYRSDDARSRSLGGNGLGLAISLDVAKRHGFVLALQLEQPTGLRASLCGALV